MEWVIKVTSPKFRGYLVLPKNHSFRVVRISPELSALLPLREYEKTLVLGIVELDAFPVDYVELGDSLAISSYSRDKGTGIKFSSKGRPEVIGRGKLLQEEDSQKYFIPIPTRGEKTEITVEYIPLGNIERHLTGIVSTQYVKGEILPILNLTPLSSIYRTPYSFECESEIHPEGYWKDFVGLRRIGYENGTEIEYRPQFSIYLNIAGFPKGEVEYHEIIGKYRKRSCWKK